MSTSPPLVVADRYRLVAPLGQGGMGRVWRATDVVLHRDVAIKELVPPPGLTPEERQEMRERSLREARAIARLNNINVVRVFDVLRTDADPWIVMEYVPSRSLQDRLATDGPFPPVRAAEIGLGVLNALRAAHRNGVVHRDVKPGNVLIGDDGRVVLTDFGLATVPGDPNVTRTGLVLGSPAYIAPERARDGTAGPAADMWSLGATLYAAVEGASPFARSSAIATLAALATENPPPARNAGPLKPVLNGLLRKDPTHRINADEAERLLLRAAGRKSKLAFPMSPTMRRPGVGRERPAYQAGPPVIPGMPTAAGSAPVVPGPRPPVTPGRPAASGEGRPPASGEGGPPVTPGRTPASGEGRPPVFIPGKASVGRAPRPAETRVDTPVVRDDQDLPGTGYSAQKSAPETIGERPGGIAEPHGALAKGTRGTYGTITPGAAADRSASTDRTAEESVSTSRQAAQQEDAERQEAERQEAERQEAERQEAERQEAERQEAERQEAERAAADRAVSEREATERKAAAEREVAKQREAAERAAAEREAAERATAHREAAERAAATEREAAERGAQVRHAAVEETADRTPEDEQRAVDPTTTPSPVAGGPLAGTDSDDADGATPGTAPDPHVRPAAIGDGAEESSVDQSGGTPGKAAANRPAVGARAGAHSTSKAARRKSRGRGSAGPKGIRGGTPAAAPTEDAAPALDRPHATTAGAIAAPDTTAETSAVDQASTGTETETPAEPELARTPPHESDGGLISEAGTESERPSEAEEPGQSTAAETAPSGEAGPDETAEDRAKSSGVTVLPMRTGTDVPDRSTGASRGGKTKPKVAAARSGDRQVATATLTTPDAPTVPESRTARTRPLDGAAGPVDTGAAAFTGSTRPAWQPMQVEAPTADRGLTVLGTTLTRRQTAVGGAVLLALLLLLVLLVPKAVGDDKPSGRPTAGAAPAASAPATPTTTPTTPSQQPTTTPPSTAPTTSGAAALPAGWYLYHDTTGFSVPVPNGWSISRRGSEMYFQERGGQYRLLIVDQTDKPKPDPVKDWETQEAARISSYRNYHRISIHEVSYWDKAADWEYTRTSDSGNLLHVVKRGFITAKDRAYGITWSTSAGDWNANKANLQLIYKGFVPAKS